MPGLIKQLTKFVQRAAVAVVLTTGFLSIVATGGGDVRNSIRAIASNQTVRGDGVTVVTLNGSAIPSSGASISTYSWTQTAGPAVTLTNPDMATATFTAPNLIGASTAATLVFQFTVADSKGKSASATARVTALARHAVDISWAANHETAVNSAGGGYIVNVNDIPPITVNVGPTPTTTTVQLWTGTYTATVTAKSALNPPGGSSGSTSAPSAPLTVVVP